MRIKLLSTSLSDGEEEGDEVDHLTILGYGEKTSCILTIADDGAMAAYSAAFWANMLVL